MKTTVKLTQPTTVKAYLEYNAYMLRQSKLVFIANFGEEASKYDAKLPKKVFFEGEKSFSDFEKGRKIMFTMEITPTENGWVISKLVRNFDNKVFIGEGANTSKYAHLSDELR